MPLIGEDLADRLAVQQVRVQRAGTDKRCPVARLPQFLEGLVPGGDVDGHRPGARVAGQREQGEAVEVREQPGDERGGLAGRGPENRV